MPFDAITTAELAPGKPITNSLMERLRARDEYLNGQIGTLGAIEILNNSFEISDTAITGGAANWTVTLKSGGAATLDTSTSETGSQSMKFTHPGGNGNGGAVMLSDFFEVSENSLLDVGITYWGDSSALAVEGRLKFYNGNKSSIANKTLFMSKNIPTAPYYFFKGNETSGIISVDAGTKYVTLELTGGGTNATVAGNVYFDYTHMRQYPASTDLTFPTAMSTAYALTTSTAFVGATSTAINLREYGISGQINIPSDLINSGGAATATSVQYFSITDGVSTLNTNEHRKSGSSALDSTTLNTTFASTFAAASSGAVTITQWIKLEHAITIAATAAAAGRSAGLGSLVNQVT